MATSKELMKLFKLCEKQGCIVRQRKNNHFLIDTPGGDRIFCGSTLSDHRALKNIRSMLRKAGVDV